MTTEADRRAQILASAQRRAAAAAPPLEAAPPAMAPAPNPAQPVAAAHPPGYIAPNDVISHNPQNGFTVTRVPNGTRPGTATNVRPQMSGAVQIGMGTPQTRPNTTVTATPGRPQAPPGTTVIPGRSPGMSGATPVNTGRPGAPVAQPVQVQTQQARALTPTQAAAIAPRNVPVVDCALMLAFHARPDLVDTQLRHLGAASVRAVTTVAWINPGPVVFPETTLRLLGEIATVFPSIDMGPWLRWATAAQCVTEFVGILDDDCLPGPQWLQRAIERLQRAGEHDVVVAAGASYTADDPNALQLAGPERVPQTEESPDVGRGGWIMRTETARRIAASPRYGEILSTGLHVASVIQELGGGHILLPYTPDRSTWGMLERPRVERSMSTFYNDAANAGQVEPIAQLRSTIYYAYRESGWMPMVVAAQETTVRTDPLPEPMAQAAPEVTA